MRYWIAGFITTMALFGLGGPSEAAERAWEGHHTLRTPFDYKLDAAGFFRLPVPRPDLEPAKDELSSLFRHARQMRYAADRTKDHWQSADETEKRFAGDCEDKAIWLYARLTEKGYKDLRLVVGKFREVEKKFHVWVTYSRDGQAYILDPVRQKSVWEASRFSSGFYKPYFSYAGAQKFRHKKRS